MLISSAFLNEKLGLIEIVGVTTVMIGLIVCVLGNRLLKYFNLSNKNEKNENLIKNS